MIRICDVLRFCCKQEIVLRCHDESSESSNRGNFLELMSLLTRYNPIVQYRLLNGPQNAEYTSPRVLTSPIIQNTIIGIMASQIRRSIRSSIQKAEYFSIIVGETKDLSKQEQLLVVLCYVDPESTVASIQERFLTFFPASNLNAGRLSQYIKTILEQFSLDPQMIVSQGYNGTSIISSNCSGVQQQMREVAPYTFYVPCQAHILNLVLVGCAKKNSFASEFFALIQNLCVFMSTSKAHVLFWKSESNFILKSNQKSFRSCQILSGLVDLSLLMQLPVHMMPL